MEVLEMGDRRFYRERLVTFPGNRGVLCIATPTIGKVSETFIRRHVEELAPEKCVFLVSKIVDSPADRWKLSGKVFCRQEWQARNRLVLGILRRMGVDGEALAVRRFLKKSGVGVVMSEFLGSSLRVHDMVKPLGLPFYAHAHGHDVSARLRQERYRKAYLAYEEDPKAGIITMSDVTRDRLASIGISKEKIYKIPYGVPIPSFEGKNEEAGKPTLVQCLAVGRMVGKKAPMLLLEAFRKAWEKNPALRLIYVGGGPLFSAAEQYVVTMGLGEVVHLHSSLPHEEVLGLFKKADIFIQHSRVDPENGDEEGLPLSILEAMARYLPVVSTRHAGIPEAVVEEESGLLSDENDVASMAENIIRMGADRKLRLRMGDKGRERAKEFYSWDRERIALRSLLFEEGEDK